MSSFKIRRFEETPEAFIKFSRTNVFKKKLLELLMRNMSTKFI